MERRSSSYPDGVSEKHLHSSFAARRLNWLALLVLGGVVMLALAGVFGGQPYAKRTAQGAGASLSVQAPDVLRNGQIFEFRIAVAANRNLAAPAIAIDDDYWRDITINTIRPEPASYDYDEGKLLLKYDALAAGEALAVTIAGQVNPVLGRTTRGAAELRDGDAVLAELPVKLQVLP